MGKCFQYLLIEKIVVHSQDHDLDGHRHRILSTIGTQFCHRLTCYFIFDFRQ
jgi:hypothetical protein